MSSTPRSAGLGKGLGALIPTGGASQEAETAADERFRQISVESISPNPFQPRRDFDEQALASLTESIKQLGVIQPIQVRRTKAGAFELIAGERRWRAARAAGLTEIPAFICDVDDQTSLAHAIVENVQRAELNPIEEAAAFQQLIDDFDLTQEQVAIKVGRSRPAVANSLRLLSLPEAIQAQIVDSRISAGHGRILVSLESSLQAKLAKQAEREEMSVRALEALVRELTSDSDEEPTKPKEPGQTRPVALIELEEILEEWFETTVDISLSSGKGKLTINFADIDDLQRIYEIIVEDSSDEDSFDDDEDDD